MARSPPAPAEASIVLRMRVLITGGSGYIGRRLAASLAADQHEVISLSRRPETAPPQSGVRFIKWDARTAEGDWVNELAGAQGIVNLAGASIGKGRWTRRRMAAILSSRLSRSEEDTSELQSPCNLVCRLLLEKKKNNCCIPVQSREPSYLAAPV